MSKKYEFPKSMNDVPTHYCGGCGHGIVHKLIAQVIDEMNIQQDVLLVAPVGCAVYAYNYINVDSCEAAHGRAPAVATLSLLSAIRVMVTCLLLVPVKLFTQQTVVRTSL